MLCAGLKEQTQLDANHLDGGRGTALFQSPGRQQQSELAPKPKAEAAQAPETQRFFLFSLKSFWQGFQSPSVSTLAPKIMCGECNAAAQLSGNRQHSLFSRTIIAFLKQSFLCLTPFFLYIPYILYEKVEYHYELSLVFDSTVVKNISTLVPHVQYDTESTVLPLSGFCGADAATVC